MSFFVKFSTTAIVTLAIAAPVFASTIVQTPSSTIAPSQMEQVQFLEDEGASQRIDFSGKLRMLSERIPAAVCNLTAGIAPDASRDVLISASAEFSQIVDALEFGDADLGITVPEERRKTLMQIADLRGKWAPMEAVAVATADGGSPDDAADVAGQSAEVLASAQLLVSEISGQYSNPTALLQSDAITIDIAGRQRMLTQRMSKNVCLVQSGLNTEAAMAELAATMQIFDTSLGALRNGMTDAGINVPPNAEVENALDVVLADWETLAPLVQATLDGETLAPSTRADVFQGMNTMTAHMNTAVGLYSEASKLSL